MQVYISSGFYMLHSDIFFIQINLLTSYTIIVQSTNIESNTLAQPSVQQVTDPHIFRTYTGVYLTPGA